MLSGRDLALESYKRKQQQEFSDSLPMPNMGTANSTQAVYESGDGPLANVMFKGLLGGATFNDYKAVAKELAQGVARGYGTAGAYVAKNLTHTADTDMVDPNTWFGTSETAGKVGRAIFGKDKPFNAKDEEEDLYGLVGLEGGSAVSQGRLAVLLTALDFTGMGKQGAKGLLKVLNDVENVEDAGKILRTAGFDDDLVEEYSTVFANTKTTKDTTAALKSLTDLQATTRVVESTPLRTPQGYDPITVKGGEAFTDAVSNIRNKIEFRAKEAGIPNVKRSSDAPTVAKLSTAIKAIEQAGGKVDDLLSDLEDIKETVKIEPDKFGDDVVPTLPKDFVRGGAIPTAGDGPVYLTANTVDGENYARGYTLKESVKTGKVGQIASAKLDEGVQIFDVRKKEDIERLRTTAPEAAAAIEAGVRDGNVDWQVANKYLKEVEEAGFDGMRMREREAGSPVFDSAGKQVKTTSAVDSVAVFDRRKIEWTDTKKALDEVANPIKENLGVLSVHVQERYGKAAVTKGKAEKFRVAEKAVFNSLFRFAEEAAYVAENGGEMVQKMPSWVPAELRDVVLFDHLLSILQRGEIPASHASREMALYTEMVDETARRAGIVKKGPKPAVNADGAILESMRNNLRRPGDKTNPLVKSEAKVGEDVVAEKEFSFEQADDAVYVDDYAAQEEALAAYNKFRDEKYSSKIGKGKGKKVGEQSKPYGVDLSLLTDTSKFKSVARDVYRNAERVFGEQWPIIKEKIFDPFDGSKGKMVDEEKLLTDRLHTKIVKELGIGKGSKLSRAVMDFGEGEVDYDSLVREFGKEKADNVVEAAQWFRAEYDRMITEVNAVQRQIYPNDPSKITRPRKDYFRHYQDMSIGFTNMFEDVNLGNLPSTLRPDESRGAKSKWQSFKQERLGWRSKRDAVGGFLNYVPQFVYTKHIDPEVARMDGFIKDLEAGTETSKNLGNFIEGIRKWKDDLAGQANFFDRFAEYAPGGRWTLDKLDFMNKRAKRNAILGNAGASISQIFNVPGAIASAGPVHSTKAVLRTMGEIFHTVDVRPGWEQGTFIKERYRHSMYGKFDTKLVDQPMKLASWLLGVLDEVGTKFAWNAHYEKALTEGMDTATAVKYADEWARKSVAGRGVGEVPVLQKSKAFQMVAPFQLEVMNQWWLMKDFMDEKEYAKFATLFAAYFIFNEVSEEIKGTSVGFDPIQAFYDSYKIYEDELEEPEGKAKKIAGRLSGEVLSNIPLGSYATTGIAGIAGMNESEREDFFGEADPVRFGNAPLLWNAVTDPLFGIMPTWGGAQMKKTWGGIRALAEGKVRDKEGKVMYDVPVEPGLGGAMQNILFGPYATNFQYRDEVENEMRSFYQANMVAVLNGEQDRVKAELGELPENLQSVYIKVAKEEKKREEDIAVKNMVPTYLIAKALAKEGKGDEAKKILNGLDEKEKELYLKAAKVWNNKDIADTGASSEEAPVEKKSFNDYLPLLMQQRDVGAQDVSPDADKWVIKTALDFAYAFGFNPQQAFEVVFLNNDIIRDTQGGMLDGVVRTERMPYKDGDVLKGSDSTKNKLMKEEGLSKNQKSEYYLEHKIPLGFGGSNEAENLFISTAKQHNAWTDTEKMLTNAVKDGKLDYKEAQALILRHKGYGGEPITYEEIQAIVNQK